LKAIPLLRASDFINDQNSAESSCFIATDFVVIINLKLTCTWDLPDWLAVVRKESFRQF
jgi:hypothetical protein